MSDNIIFSVAAGYTFGDIALFLGSLKKTGFNGSVYLFVSGMNFIDRYALEDYGLNIIACQKRFPFYRSKIDIPCKLSTKTLNKLGAEYHRFIIYYLFLKSSLKKFQGKNILLTDIRDIVFQKDPFDYNYDKGKLYFFAENKDCSIQQNNFNSSWIRTFYGSTVLGEIGKYPCICSGIILGPAERIIVHLEEMTRHICNVRQVVKGGDQAIHEFIIYKEGIDNYEILNNEDGPAIHLHTLEAKDITVDENGYVRNRSNAIVNIVHQYDRHPFLREAFLQKYNLVKSYSNKLYVFLDRAASLITVFIRRLKNT